MVSWWNFRSKDTMSFNSELVLESKYGEAMSGVTEPGCGALAWKTISLANKNGDGLADADQLLTELT